MTGQHEYPIGEVARLAHVSVRTLHHYESVGLLRPSGRTAAGHRRYAAADLARLREILFYRELDFGLDEIAAMLADPAAGTDDRLRAQHRLLRARMARHEHLLEALEKEMEARTMGISLTPEEQFEIFGTNELGGEWAEEAEQRWGETEAWTQSQRRTAAYTKDDWIQIKREEEANRTAFADAMRAGLPVTDPGVVALAAAHRTHITKWFYDCTPEIHRGLAELYLADERFRRTYDDVAPGLAQYVHDAILAS
ncbi:MAG TPA: MerR family transcriptional regulator [Jatrophihabitans sp.]|uniref:MerR family transcriptional regulator n=1 Tax=Jatrophihabitans sp. TaxID=1932789 RepID=UPI002E006C23|nr:MerR family transcriptional regulator [Jatrophihabitans sp.]